MDQGAIGKLGNKVEDTGSAQKVTGDPASDATAKGRQSSGDTVELTSSAKLLERLEQTLSSIPDVDASRVAAVKADIANGAYQIDASAIADAMIRFERPLGE